ncbi:SSI family serine proteinase inhibitor [Streptomyces sp. CC224B]|uniref:SSI family serine proteinase inhibitor n=1 Tax=Streptomyces sp. CC224B TaxID=3044571 RepID=UPI0024A9F16D|nr:SSI family serine proteinase inhibitor [Streptomyces sp. CC224B]
MRPRTAAPAALLALAATALPALTPPATAAPAPPVPARPALTALADRSAPADEPSTAWEPSTAGEPTPAGKPKPAHAPSTHAPSTHERGVLLTVSGSENTWIRGVRLSCVPEPSGPHPFAGRACAELDQARGDLDALPKENRACTKRFDPVTVSATGTHRGRPVTWHRTYGNACEMAASTGHVFRF